MLVLRLYTSSSYPRFNTPLRQRVKPHPFAMSVYFLDEALRKLKQRFVEGKGKMRYVGLEMGDGDLGRPRQKRARRGGAEADSETTGCLLARLEIC